jgi:crossover junction endodeoxyribonuclease RuvC
MFDGCVLGVDPGIARTGLAAVGRRDRTPVILMADIVKTPSGLDDAARLRIIHEAVGSAISTHEPGSMAVERVMWGKNHTSALAVARATGVILLAASQAGIPVEEYAPLEVKMAVTGLGNADKDQVHTALARTHGLTAVPNEPDAADAVAIALCHLTQARLRAAAERAGAR